MEIICSLSGPVPHTSFEKIQQTLILANFPNRAPKIRDLRNIIIFKFQEAQGQLKAMLEW